MQSVIQRFRNIFTWFGIAVFILGIGMNLVFAFAPNLVTSHSQLKTLIFLGFGLVLLAIILFIIGFFRTPVSAKQVYLGIIPTLQKMDDCLIKIAKQEAKKYIDWQAYGKTNDKINKDLLKFITPKAKTIKGAKRVFSKWEYTLKERYIEKVISIQTFIEEIEPTSIFLDSRGFGLKQFRTTNGKYLRLSRKMEYYRNLLIGTEINDLIRLHIRVSECSSNVLLAVYRGFRAKANVQGQIVSVLDFMSTEMQTYLEPIESNIKEVTSIIRARIGELINELDKNGSNKEIEQPSIEVISNGFSLRVNNNGTCAKFRANIKIIADYMNYHTNEIYIAYWQISQHDETKIMKGNFDNIVIAGAQDLPPTNPPAIGIKMFYYDLNSKTLDSWNSGVWFFTTKQQNAKIPPPEYELEVTITSNPALTETFIRHYKLNLEGLHEI